MLGPGGEVMHRSHGGAAQLGGRSGAQLLHGPSYRTSRPGARLEPDRALPGAVRSMTAMQVVEQIEHLALS